MSLMYTHVHKNNARTMNLHFFPFFFFFLLLSMFLEIQLKKKINLKTLKLLNHTKISNMDLFLGTGFGKLGAAADALFLSVYFFFSLRLCTCGTFILE